MLSRRRFFGVAGIGLGAIGAGALLLKCIPKVAAGVWFKTPKPVLSRGEWFTATLTDPVVVKSGDVVWYRMYFKKKVVINAIPDGRLETVDVVLYNDQSSICLKTVEF